MIFEFNLFSQYFILGGLNLNKYLILSYMLRQFLVKIKINCHRFAFYF
jgi:hypothetical protein